MIRRGIGYSPEEDALLRELYPKAPLSELASRFNRNPYSLRYRAQKLGILRENCEGQFPTDQTMIGHLTEAEKGYLAGLIDGEGTIVFVKISSAVRQSYQTRVQIYNTDKRMIEWVLSRLPSGRMSVQKHSEGNRKVLYQWICSTNAATTLLREIQPYLVIKQEQAEALKNGYRHLTDEQRRALFEYMQAVKRDPHILPPNFDTCFHR
jgi:hypothetical protein